MTRLHTRRSAALPSWQPEEQRSSAALAPEPADDPQHEQRQEVAAWPAACVLKRLRLRSPRRPPFGSQPPVHDGSGGSDLQSERTPDKRLKEPRILVVG